VKAKKIKKYVCVYNTEKMILLRSKILLDTDLKIILLDHQNNFVGTLKIMSNAAKDFYILATS